MSLFNKFLLLILTSFPIISSCNSEQVIFNNDILNKNIFFDAVEKSIVIDDSFPISIKNKINYVYQNNFKTNGLEGSSNFIFDRFEKTEELIENGKKVTIKLVLNVEIFKNKNNSKKILRYNIEEFGQITGDFSVKDYERLVESIENNTINSLLKNLN
tara:strand:+ start:172 stop:645 length:474 start_codon:yes stop_codon:yes gene_type:complete